MRCGVPERRAASVVSRRTTHSFLIESTGAPIRGLPRHHRSRRRRRTMPLDFADVSGFGWRGEACSFFLLRNRHRSRAS
jgi:hypothetical protein